MCNENHINYDKANNFWQSIIISIYQFKVSFNLYDDGWKDFSFEHAQLFIQKMKDYTIESLRDNI